MHAQVLALMASASLIVGARSQSVALDSTMCPPDNPDTRRAVLRFLTKPTFADDRSQLGLTVADTAGVRVLVDSTDRATCRWFREQVTIPTDRPRDAAYYHAGGFYFVSNVPRCTLCTAWGGLAVFDTTFALKGVFAN